MKGAIKTLVLTLRYPHRASYYDDWADAFAQSGLFRATIMNLYTLSPRRLRGMAEEHDLVVLLHSCTSDTTAELDRFQPVLAERKRARLLAFIGNEFNSPYAPMGDKIAVIGDCRADIIATQLLEEAGRYLYDGLGARVISLPHALNPDVFRPGPPDADRRIDIGVRNFRYSPLLGDQERNRVIDYINRRGPDHGLVVDIDDEHRFARADWAAFLASCRGTVSSEAGSWYLERDDALVKRIKAYTDTKRTGVVLDDHTPARRLIRRLPLPVKSALGWLARHGPVKYAAFEDARLDFDELYERFFKTAPKCPAYSKALSSRHLDAAGTCTCQILLRGRYNDILRAGEHYIPVAPDLSDIDEAITRFKDRAERERIARAAHEHVMSQHTYAHRMAELHEMLGAL